MTLITVTANSQPAPHSDNWVVNLPGFKSHILPVSKRIRRVSRSAHLQHGYRIWILLLYGEMEIPLVFTSCLQTDYQLITCYMIICMYVISILYNIWGPGATGVIIRLLTGMSQVFKTTSQVTCVQVAFSRARCGESRAILLRHPIWRTKHH